MKSEVIVILQALYEQLICGYDVQKLDVGLFYIPSQKIYMEVKTDDDENVKKLSLTTKKPKKNKKGEKKLWQEHLW